MRTLSRSRSLTAWTIAVTAAASLAAGGRPAAAQTVLPANQYTAPIAIRLGAYFPQNGRITRSIGNIAFAAGVDYSVEAQPGLSRANISVDYFQRDQHGRSLSVVPVTIGYQQYAALSQGVRPYLGLGVGAYFIRENLIQPDGSTHTDNDTTLGGYLMAGLEFTNNVFFDARYHIVSQLGGVSAGGAQVSVGYRF